MNNLIPKMNNFEENSEKKKKRGLLKRIGFKRLTLLTLIVVSICGIWGTVHYYNKYKALIVNPDAENQKMIDESVALLGKLMQLPKNEQPIVQVIADKTKLNSEPFFADAENNDILFAYTTAMKAILYRPSTNKIINVAPIKINSEQSTNSTVKQVTTSAATSTGTSSSTKSTKK